MGKICGRNEFNWNDFTISCVLKSPGYRNPSPLTVVFVFYPKSTFDWSLEEPAVSENRKILQVFQVFSPCAVVPHRIIPVVQHKELL